MALKLIHRIAMEFVQQPIYTFIVRMDCSDNRSTDKTPISYTISHETTNNLTLVRCTEICGKNRY